MVCAGGGVSVREATPSLIAALPPLDAEGVLWVAALELVPIEQRVEWVKTMHARVQGINEKRAQYVLPEGDERCAFTMDACTCMKRKGHDGLHACAHGGWRGDV